MSDEDMEISIFVRRVLTCMKEQRITKEKIRKEYISHYPPSFWKKQFSAPVSEVEIERGLKQLIVLGFVGRELTRWYEGETLSVDTPIYSVTNEGRFFLYHKK